MRPLWLAEGFIRSEILERKLSSLYGNSLDIRRFFFLLWNNVWTSQWNTGFIINSRTKHLRFVQLNAVILLRWSVRISMLCFLLRENSEKLLVQCHLGILLPRVLWLSLTELCRRSSRSGPIRPEEDTGFNEVNREWKTDASNSFLFQTSSWSHAVESPLLIDYFGWRRKTIFSNMKILKATSPHEVTQHPWSFDGSKMNSINDHKDYFNILILKKIFVICVKT